MNGNHSDITLAFVIMRAPNTTGNTRGVVKINSLNWFKMDLKLFDTVTV